MHVKKNVHVNVKFSRPLAQSLCMSEHEMNHWWEQIIQPKMIRQPSFPTLFLACTRFHLFPVMCVCLLQKHST